MLKAEYKTLSREQFQLILWIDSNKQIQRCSQIWSSKNVKRR
jgi:hypothetical protein